MWLRGASRELRRACSDTMIAGLFRRVGVSKYRIETAGVVWNVACQPSRAISSAGTQAAETRHDPRTNSRPHPFQESYHECTNHVRIVEYRAVVECPVRAPGCAREGARPMRWRVPERGFSL